jgi:hypothetical protein
MNIGATGSSVRNCVSAAATLAGLTRVQAAEVLRSGGEDWLYRVHLAGGHDAP